MIFLHVSHWRMIAMVALYAYGEGAQVAGYTAAHSFEELQQPYREGSCGEAVRNENPGEEPIEPQFKIFQIAW
jgi:hypothetical protein